MRFNDISGYIWEQSLKTLQLLKIQLEQSEGPSAKHLEHG